MSKLPLAFIPNVGQTDPVVRFLVKGTGYTIVFTSEEVVLGTTVKLEENEVKSSLVRLRFAGANPNPAVDGLDQLPWVANFFMGNDPTKWRANVPTYSAIVYRELYPGIDLVYKGTEARLKSEFHVSPGADPGLIRLIYSGIQSMYLREDGALVLQTGIGKLIEEAPAVYQEIKGERVEVEGSYRLLGEGRVGFTLRAYDPHYPLVIDPMLFLPYSTYLSSTGTDLGYDIAVDSTGSVYITGLTSLSGFGPINIPDLEGPTPFNRPTDVFVAKLDPTGSTLVYYTYLGGNGEDSGNGVAVDASGNVYVTGYTWSTDFPTLDPLQSASGGDVDAFVTKLDSTGSLVYSTYLGGSDEDVAHGIAVDASGNAYIAGYTYSTDFPTQNPLQAALGGEEDAFVSKLAPTGSALVYSTYLGGVHGDRANDIAADFDGNAYVVGYTDGADFPTTEGAFDRRCWCCRGGPCSYFPPTKDEAFVAKLDPTGSTLVYSTFLGGSRNDRAYGIAVDASGNAYVTGYTASDDFPTTEGAFDRDCGADGDGSCESTGYPYFQISTDAFLVKLDPTGTTLLYGTYLGGSGSEFGMGVAVDSDGSAYVTGSTPEDFPTANPFQPVYGGGNSDAFVVKLDPTGSALIYSTYLGGSSDERGLDIAVDADQNAYITGETWSIDFPKENPLQPSYAGWADTFVTKITMVEIAADLVLEKTASPDPVNVGENLTYTIEVTNNGPDPATGVALTDTLPAEINFISVDASQGNCTQADDTVTCDLETINNGDTATVTIIITPTMAGNISNTASVSANEADPDTTNNELTIITTVIQTVTEPFITSFSPEELINGDIRTLTIFGGNFDQGATVRLSRGDRGEPNPGDVIGNILSLSSDTIEAEFDLVSTEILGEWDVIVENPDGKTASRPIFINPAIIWVDYDWDGIRGYFTSPPGQGNASYLTLFNVGNEEGLVLITLYPPEPDYIRLIIGPKSNPIWDSAAEPIRDTVDLLIWVPPRQEVRIPLYWEISWDYIAFPSSLMIAPAGSVSLSSQAALKTYFVGQVLRLKAKGFQGVTKAVLPAVLVDAVINSTCEVLRDAIAEFLELGDPLTLRMVLKDVFIEGIEETVEGYITLGGLLNKGAVKLARIPRFGNIALGITTCGVDIFFDMFNRVIKRLDDHIRRNSKWIQHLTNQMVELYRGRSTARDTLIDSWQQEPCSPLPSYPQSWDAPITGRYPWDPNDKAANSLYPCQLGEVNGEIRCVRYLIPMVNATDPIEYVIQFENKKEATAPAQNIVITDVLDTNLDPSTLEVISTSHPAAFSMEMVGNIVTFRFTDINLPPNQNPPEGEGYVMFSVRPRSNLPPGTEIHNKASIVFDFMPPIETSEVVHVLKEFHGDVNVDGKINIRDATLAARIALGLIHLIPGQEEAADVAEPCGVVDARDVVRIAEVALGIRDESIFTCGGGTEGGLGVTASSIHRSKTIRFSIANQELLPGERANIGIAASAAVEGIQVGPQGSLSFDPQAIRIKKIRGVPPFQVLASQIDNETGKAKFMAIALGEPQSGDILEIEIEAVGREGESTTIRLAPDMVLDAEGNELRVGAVEGRLTLGRAVTLTLDRVLSVPNPVRNGARFVAEGQGIKDIQVQIYDLSGREIFASGWVAGKALEWNLMSNRGRPVANGVYLYIVTVRGFGGELVQSQVKKLVVLR